MPRLQRPPRARPGAPNWSSDGKDWPHREASTFWQVGSTVWHVQRRGTGPQVLLLHGTGAATHSWAPILDHFASRFDTISLDLPRHGFTQVRPGFRPSLPNMSAEVAKLIREMALSPSMIVGHSAGAAVALHLTDQLETTPELLVSINGALEPFEGVMQFIAPIAAKAATLGGLAAWMVSRNSANVAGVRRLVTNIGSDPDLVDPLPYSVLLQKRAHIQGALQMMAQWDLRALMRAQANVRVPVLFLAGVEDQAVPRAVSERAAGRTQNGTYLEFEALGHLAHEEAPDRVAAAILDHWDRLQMQR
ncbi:MAG: alpha/beta fold hydrolase BchO [Pseudomonadota bacterium]